MSRRSPFVYSLCASSVLLLALTANTAQAARHMDGLELGAGMGYNIMQTGQLHEQQHPDYVLKDYNNLQWGLHAGYWWPLASNWQWGIQLGYQHLGDSYHFDSAYTRPVHAVQVADYLLGLRYYAAPNIALQGKLGVAHQWLKLGFAHLQSKQFAFNPEWQLGVLYDINSKLSAELMIDRIAGSAVGDIDARNPASMAILAGLNWRLLAQKQHTWHQRKHLAGLELGAGMGYNIMQTGQLHEQRYPDYVLKDYNNLQWGLHAGYWWPLASNWQWGIQLGYQHLGDSYHFDSAYTRPVHAVQVADYLLGLRYYAAPNIALQGKLGVAHQWLKLGLAHLQSKQFAFNPEWQLGVLYDINPKLSAELTIDRIIGSAVGHWDARNPASMAILAGLNWRLLAHKQHSWHQHPHLAGLELGAGMGYSIMQTGQVNAQSLPDYVLKDYNNLQWGVHAGYWWSLASNWQWGMQLGYQHLGDTNYTYESIIRNNTYDKAAPVHAAQVADYLLGLRYYAAPNIALQGKLGVAHQWVKLGNTFVGYGPLNDHRSKVFAFNPEWQLGVLYDINSKLSAEFMIDRIAGSAVGENDARNPASMAILAGLNWGLTAQKQHTWHQHKHLAGLELGAGMGYSIMQTGQYNSQAGNLYVHKDYNNLQWGMHAGYWWSLANNWQWGMQLGYLHLGDSFAYIVNSRTVNALQMADYLLGLRYYAAPNIALQGKLGVAHQWFKLARDNVPSKYFAFNPEWQLGVLYDINSKLSAELMIDRIAGSAVGVADARNPASMGIMLGLNWRVLS